MQRGVVVALLRKQGAFGGLWQLQPNGGAVNADDDEHARQTKKARQGLTDLHLSTFQLSLSRFWSLEPPPNEPTYPTAIPQPISPT